MSMLRVHIVPRWGARRLLSLSGKEVLDAIKELKVVPNRRGATEAAPAARGTQNNFRRALLAVWNATFPGQPAPFEGLKLPDTEADLQRRRRILDEIGSETESALDALHHASGAMTPSDFRRALAAACWYDRHYAARKNLAHAFVPNTAHAIAIQTALGLRVSELLNLRWRDIDEAGDFVRIRGTKTKSALRIVPLQESVQAWLQDLRRLTTDIRGQAPEGNWFVIFTNPRARPTRRATETTVIHRYARALSIGGVKPQGKATHWTRATHYTWGAGSSSITLEELKRYLGHVLAYGGSADSYIATHVIARMKPEHRTYIQLPSPTEMAMWLTHPDPKQRFQPLEQPSWRTWKPPYRRDKESIEAREQRRTERAQAEPLGWLTPRRRR